MSWDQLLCELRAASAPRGEPDLARPVASFAGRELHRGSVVDTLAVILRTTGCAWARGGGCTMCGYPAEAAGREPTTDELVDQLRAALREARGGPFPLVKLYTSGSFLDPGEVPPEAAARLLSSLPGGTEKVVVETRPQYATGDALASLVPLVPRLEVALGLESASDLVLRRCVHKGFTFADYTIAIQAARDAGAGVRTYLLLKPPFMGERDAAEDARSSLEAAALFSDHVSLNLATVQRGTYVEYLWRRWGYRPPWLWSAVDLARWWAREGPGDCGRCGAAGGGEAKENAGGGRDANRVPLTVDPVGAGSPRGPHNCGRCDREVAAALRRFSLTQDAHEFDALRCGCRGLYEKGMELEEVAFGATLLR